MRTSPVTPSRGICDHRTRDSGGTLQQAARSILAVQKRFPDLRHKLLLAWGSITSWRLHRPSRPRVPVTLGMLHAVIAAVWAKAASLDGHWALRFWAGGVLLWLGYEALLRPGELLMLRPARVQLGQRIGLHASVMTVTVDNPKNRRHFGRRQFVLLNDPKLIQWVAWLMSGLPQHAPLIDGGRSALSAVLRYGLRALSSEGMGISFASLRTGGATHHFMQHSNLGQLQYRGRWRDARSLEHYLQEAVAACVDIRLTPECRAQVELGSQAFNFLPGPPPIPLAALGATRWPSKRWEA